MPRQMEFEKLVAVLVSEHAQMTAGLQTLRAALETKDYDAARSALSELKEVFARHIADEEGQVLRILIDAYGVKGADDAIEVFRQHRPIYNLMKAIEQFSSLSPEEFRSKEAELKELFAKHTTAEESHIFPWALSTSKSKIR